MAPPMAKTLLDRLPDEILLEIIKLSTSWDGSSRELDLDTAVQLSLVCCRFARIVQPLMYGRFDHHSFESGTLFLRTLNQNPELGKLLKSLVSLRPKGTLSEEDLSDLANAIEATNLDGFALLRSALVHFKLRWRVSDAQVALMMMKAPKLEELEIIEWTDLYPYGCPFWLQVLRKDYLPTLKFLAVEWKLSLQEVLPLFKLPSLHTLELRRIENPPGDLSSTLSGLFRSSTLQSLRLIGCELHPSALAGCIRSCANLHTFQYMYDRCIQAYDFITHFNESNLNELWDAIVIHKSTLKSLCLNWTLLEVDVPLFQGGICAGLPPSLLDFSDFPELSYLDIPLDLMRLCLTCGKECDMLPRRLPRNMQTLHINRADSLTNVQDELLAIAFARPELFRSLQQVHLENQNYVHSAQWKEVEEVFKRAAVTFKIERLYLHRTLL